jgi:hypothetical protein
MSEIATSAPPSSPVQTLAELRRRARLDEALRLQYVAPGCWRVYDGPALSGHDPILAFIQQRDETFEVMQVAGDFVWTIFPTMRDALTHIVATSEAVLRARSAGELSWLT